MLQLGVQVPDEGPTSHNLSMAVIEGQSSVAHVFTIDALCPSGHTDDLSLLHISTCARKYTDIAVVSSSGTTDLVLTILINHFMV